MSGIPVLASEADLAIPDLHQGYFENFGLDAWHLLLYGSIVIVFTLSVSLTLFRSVKKLTCPSNLCLSVAATIYETCKTYLIQQGKFLLILFAFIGIAIAFYFLTLEGTSFSGFRVLLFSVVGI